MAKKLNPKALQVDTAMPDAKMLDFISFNYASIDLIGYSDADYSECKIDRKSIRRACQFFGLNLIFWFRKKQNLIALSMVEAEYIAVRSCCAPILWFKQ